MKFNDFKYERPDLDLYKKNMTEILTYVGEDKSYDEELNAIHRYFKESDHLSTMRILVSIRNTIDTTDKFYEEETNFFNEQMPSIQEYSQTFYKKLLTSKHRKTLEKEFGELIFKQAELEQKIFSTEIIEELQIENKLSTKYSKLIASGRIEFEGKTYTLSQMAPIRESKDRETRHKAQLAVSNFFESVEAQIDEIYDEMVKVRHQMAIKLGYENFIQLAYDRLGRTDYTPIEVKSYRDQVYEYVVPFVNELATRKAKRIKIDNPKAYDLILSFLSGNPTPKGDRLWQVNIAKELYEEMAPQTSKFINYMIDNELMDLDSKPGKASGGYCNFIPDYKAPFIFANFNGTSHDVDVLTHEVGHAFQSYCSKDLIPNYRWPTLEAAEIHSMSMEFLAWPWIHKFFKEDTDKYKFNHLASSVEFLPYGVAVDEFQHEIYKNPNLTPDERKAVWRKVEKKYLPFIDYDDDNFMDKGTYWFKQGHIFGVPFYYIDYTLAQVVAYQYWVKSQNNMEKAFESYLNLCNLGGSLSFTQLIDSAKLKNPFIEGSVKEIIKPIQEYLNKIDDAKL